MARYFKEESFDTKLIVMNGGLGTHLALLNIIPAIQKKYKHIIIACCYPEVFEDLDIPIIPAMYIQGNFDQNIYAWMRTNRWEGSWIEAFAKMYEVEL